MEIIRQSCSAVRKLTTHTSGEVQACWLFEVTNTCTRLAVRNCLYIVFYTPLWFPALSQLGILSIGPNLHPNTSEPVAREQGTRTASTVVVSATAYAFTRAPWPHQSCLALLSFSFTASRSCKSHSLRGPCFSASSKSAIAPAQSPWLSFTNPLDIKV